MTTVTATEVKNGVSQPVLELTERISHGLTMDKKTGIAAVDEKTYVNLLPEGLTEEIVKQVQVHNMNFVAASLNALGEASIPVFKKQKDLPSTTLTVPMIGKDSITVNMERSSMVPGKDEAGNPTTTEKFGTSSVKMDIYGVHKRGDLLKVKRLLAESAQAAFGN